ncbi:hypothetical protein INR49_016570 [Caranx melampygus]|nr:hypothetical protein INR49_016570 [Caranx melampygus]
MSRLYITLSSAVVQVFTADRNSSWNKRCCGVACLVKDNPNRSYFIRVFDLRTCQVGMNFASEEETKRFHGQIHHVLENPEINVEDYVMDGF